jgi:hypothetical protein
MKVAIPINVGCWLLVVFLALASVSHGVWVWHHWGEKFGSANGFIDPVVFFMNYLVPVASLGVIGLFILRHYGMASRRAVISATVLFLIFTAALVIYGVWFVRRLSGSFLMSYQVWWLEPFRLFGI